jgi:hypothetical protein
MRISPPFNIFSKDIKNCFLLNIAINIGLSIKKHTPESAAKWMVGWVSVESGGKSWAPSEGGGGPYLGFTF